MPDDKNKAGRKRTASRGQLTIEAKLLDPGLPAPLPGDMYTISLMRYEVLKVLRGEYPHRFIFVGHSAPDLHSPSFRVGVVHRLQLSRKFPRRSDILNKFENEPHDAGVFFCLSFEAIDLSKDGKEKRQVV